MMQYCSLNESSSYLPAFHEHNLYMLLLSFDDQALTMM